MIRVAGVGIFRRTRVECASRYLSAFLESAHIRASALAQGFRLAS